MIFRYALFGWFMLAVFPSLGMAQISCGEPPKPPSYYSDISLYSLISAFILIFVGILSDKKPVKLASFIIAVLPLVAWGYVNFGVDYKGIEKTRYKYNTQAEATLANIAEAQDRYKSETGTFIKDLNRINSHLAGAQGLNECVSVLSLEVSFEHWTAKAKHVSSPDIITWDSTSGSSLKRG